MGIVPLRESNDVWLARFKSSRETEVRQMPGVKQIKPSVAVMVQLVPNTNAGDVTLRLKEFNALITGAFSTLPAVSAEVPLEAIPQIRKLPGVKQVKKQKVYSITTLR